METVPAVFAGVVFALFGSGLLTWIAVRVRSREPVVQDVSPVASAAVAALAAAAALTAGAWCFNRL